METQELTEILEAAVGQIPPPPSPWAIPFPGPGVLEVLVRDPDGQALQETLMKAEGLELFDDTIQVVGSGGTTFDRFQLASWLLDRGKDVGAERAVSDLQTYLESSTFRAFHVMVLVGQAVEECNEIGEDIWLVKWSELPIKWLRDWMWTIIRSPLPSRTPSAAIIQPFEHKKIHHPRNAHDHPPFFHRSIDHLEAARLCIPLMEERSAELLCHGIIPAGEVPYSGGFSWSVDADKWHKVASKITPIETARARELHGAFTSLKPDEQKRLGISLERLSSFNSRKNDVQGAIDLRVAMEAVFLADKGPELSFRTAVTGQPPSSAGPMRPGRLFSLM